MHSRPMIPPAWQRRLDATQFPDEVMAVARAFMASFSPVDVERLPSHCRPGPLTSQKEIAELALWLSHQAIDGDAATVRLVTRMAQFFSAAAIRQAAMATREVASDDA